MAQPFAHPLPLLVDSHGQARREVQRGFTQLILLAALLAAAGCATCPADPRTGRRPDSTPRPYLQVAHPEADQAQLRVAVRQFKPARQAGPVIWLVGASHIGEPDYYAALQQHLDQQDLVLYEGVKGLEQADLHQSAPAPSAPDERAGSLQVSLGRALGLVFQLEALNYTGPRYRNSDLSVAQIQALMLRLQGHPAQPGTNGAPAETEFDRLVQTMQGTSLLGALLHGFVEMVGYSPRLQSLTKLALIEMLGRFEGDLSRIDGLPPELEHLMQVIIQKRNQVVLDDLKTILRSDQPPARIAVIYGAGHLPDLEQRLRRRLRYCPAEEFWLPAFSVDTSRLTGLEVRLVRTLVAAQLEAMQPRPR